MVNAIENPKVFVSTYTNKVKQYCDEEFFANLYALTYPNKEVHVADNTLTHNYVERLEKVCKVTENLYHINVDRDGSTPKHIAFLKNVTNSVLKLREEFLKTDCDYFVTIESDVKPPLNVIELFLENIKRFPEGLVFGGLYYLDFPAQNWERQGTKTVTRTPHPLSGCTIYKRDIIEKYPFRYSEENLGAFPDAWISHDINKGEVNPVMYNCNDIVCKHMHIGENFRDRGYKGGVL